MYVIVAGDQLNNASHNIELHIYHSVFTALIFLLIIGLLALILFMSHQMEQNDLLCFQLLHKLKASGMTDRWRGRLGWRDGFR